ncbi:unnamed protein product [Diatraea saccharalis]|uniref:PDZ domain-containing protein n=1 Tax=Diatraea saccharalis TaxID=40085 RepID=A0A9N9WIU8_9NEOP|nr:unnamed protein product [Diatraea saccharalis]
MSTGHDHDEFCSDDLERNRSRSLEPLSGLAMWSDNVEYIQLLKEDRGLGFSILDYLDPVEAGGSVIVVRAVVAGGAAAADGRLQPGDRLLSVNGADVARAPLHRAVQEIKAAPRENDCTEDNYVDVNSCAVAGIISIGGGYSHLEEFFMALNLPMISNKIYQSQHNILSRNWEKVAQDSMNEAAEKERNFAIANGRISKTGVPIIDVVADGCYSKRSYKKNYSALSGAAAIIGKRTGEILFLGVKNKYCYACDRANKKKIIAKEHTCYKNYSGPSTGMEADIILEGFKQSIATHKLIYGCLISDGDSCTYNKILQAQPYREDGVTVEKIECRNHLMRNYCNKINSLTTDTKYPLSHRKIITNSKVINLRTAIIQSIKKNKNDEFPEISYLFEDILLTHHHAFGNHTGCKKHFCQKVGTNDDLVKTKDFFTSSLWQRICLLTQNLASHARSLIHDVDSNIVERYHSIVAKFVGGKRINYSLSHSYATRCSAAAVSFNTKKCLSLVYRKISNLSPKGKLKIVEERRARKNCLNRNYTKKKRRLIFKKSDENYGEECTKPDMPADLFLKVKTNFVHSLKKTDDERRRIERSTILQRDSSEWMELRRSLLTASNFGRVIKKRPNTPSANIVKDILYKSNINYVSSIHHGQVNEQKAIAQLCSQEKISITPCGLFIDEELPFLGASPDGLCGDDTIVEIKCPITAYKLGITEAINQKKVNFWVKNKKDELYINQNHNWYYQVQEIVDPRFTRNLPLRLQEDANNVDSPRNNEDIQQDHFNLPTSSETLDFVQY